MVKRIPKVKKAFSAENALVEDTTVVKKERKNKFRLASKSFFLTYPRCRLGKERALDKLAALVGDCAYAVVGHELHEDGFPHLHALVQVEEKMETRNAAFFDLEDSEDEEAEELPVIYHGNYQGARDAGEVRGYCMKSGDFVEHGEFVENKQTAVQKRQTQNRLILATPLPELVQSGEISLFSYKELRAAKALYLLDSIVVPEYMPKECLWIYGAPGVGKSRWARTHYAGRFFSKGRNKWWDGYEGQNCVLLEDVDHSWELLSHHIKIWADCYPFPAEIKGGIVRPVYDTLLVTSNYLPHQVFGQTARAGEQTDEQLIMAILRRFKIKTLDSDGLTLIDYDRFL